MTRISLPETAHRLLESHLQPGDIAIDATLGNGYDTLFLLRHVDRAGHVYGFDIQPQALEKTSKRLTEAGMVDRATLFQASHADMADRIPSQHHGEIRTIMFNLGYLPGSDKSIITQAESTIPALEAACKLLMPGGIITIVTYPGHTGGDRETGHVKNWVDCLDRSLFYHEIICSSVDKPTAPILFYLASRT